MKNGKFEVGDRVRCLNDGTGTSHCYTIERIQEGSDFIWSREIPRAYFGEDNEINWHNPSPMFTELVEAKPKYMMSKHRMT